MTRDLTICEASLEDTATLALLFSEFNAILGADGLPDEMSLLPEHVHVTREQMASRLRATGGLELAYVAEIGDEPAGLACLRLVPYVGQDAPYAELTQLFVRTQFQRLGVGAALIHAVEERAVSAGATCVHVITGRDNLAAQAFYTAQGYTMPGVEFEKHFLAVER